jgi:hypothetical protein
MDLDSTTIFKGEIGRAPGGILGVVRALLLPLCLYFHRCHCRCHCRICSCITFPFSCVFALALPCLCRCCWCAFPLYLPLPPSLLLYLLFPLLVITVFRIGFPFLRCLEKGLCDDRLNAVLSLPFCPAASSKRLHPRSACTCLVYCDFRAQQEACSECILFTDDSRVLALIEKYDKHALPYSEDKDSSSPTMKASPSG